MRRSSADPTRTLTRRDVLRLAAAAPAAFVLACAGDDPSADGVDAGAEPDGMLAEPDAAVPPVPPEDTAASDGFPLGVSAGDPTGTAIVLWTRYAGALPLAVAVWEMDGDTYVREVGALAVAPADGGFVHVELGGLLPGRRYRYAFFEVDWAARVGRSSIGRFRAAIAADALEPMTLGAVSCTEAGRPFDPLARAAEDELDLFVFLGDTAYCDGAEVVAEYRDKWQAHLGDPASVALRASVGQLITWDDHEVVNDFDPETVPAEQLAAARQAFFEHAPLRRVQAAPDRIWRRLRWGKTAEVFLLDCRSERRPSSRGSDEEIYLSRAQMDWLKAGLAASQAVFKLIINTVPITNMPLLFDLASGDRWEGYPSQRDEILQFIDAAAIPGVLWLAGDFHLAFVSQIGAPGQPGASQREILVGPGAKTSNPLALTLQPPRFAWASGTNNYGRLVLDPASRTIRVVHVAGDGQPIHDDVYAV